MSTNDKQTPEATAADLEQAKAAAHAEGKKEGATAERARVKGILASEEATERGSLAAHLAFDTDMSVEASVALLSKSAKEAKAATPEPDKKAESDFEKAMNEGKNPNVGAHVGSDNGEPESADAKAAAILADFGAASGHTPKK